MGMKQEDQDEYENDLDYESFVRQKHMAERIVKTLICVVLCVVLFVAGVCLQVVVIHRCIYPRYARINGVTWKTQYASKGADRKVLLYYRGRYDGKLKVPDSFHGMPVAGVYISGDQITDITVTGEKYDICIDKCRNLKVLDCSACGDKRLHVSTQGMPIGEGLTVKECQNLEKIICYTGSNKDDFNNTLVTYIDLCQNLKTIEMSGYGEIYLRRNNQNPQLKNLIVSKEAYQNISDTRMNDYEEEGLHVSVR